MSDALRVVTWNVNGIRARVGALLQYLEERRPDVLCLQEVKASVEQVPREILEHPDYVAGWNCAPTGYSGVGVLVRRTVGEVTFQIPPFDMENRVLRADFGPLSVVNLYCPNGGKAYEPKLAFYDALLAFAAGVRASGDLVWLCGDFNIAHTDQDIHPKERKDADIGVRPEERERLGRLMDLGCRDVFRRLHPEASEAFTWWPYWRNARKLNRGWRIDYHLVPDALCPAVGACLIEAEVVGSDHAPVAALVDAAAFRHG